MTIHQSLPRKVQRDLRQRFKQTRNNSGCPVSVGYLQKGFVANETHQVNFQSSPSGFVYFGWIPCIKIVDFFRLPSWVKTAEWLMTSADPRGMLVSSKNLFSSCKLHYNWIIGPSKVIVKKHFYMDHKKFPVFSPLKNSDVSLYRIKNQEFNPKLHPLPHRRNPHASAGSGNTRGCPIAVPKWDSVWNVDFFFNQKERLLFLAKSCFS